MYDTAGTAHCEHCGKSVYVIIEDWGVGPYEYCGAQGVDIQNVPVCEECGNEITDSTDYFEVERG